MLGLATTLNSCKNERIIQQGSFEETLELNRQFTKRILRFVQDKNLENLKYKKLSPVQLEDYLESTAESDSFKENQLTNYTNSYSIEKEVLEIHKDMNERNLLFNEDSQNGTYQLKMHSTLNNTEFQSYIRLNKDYGFYVSSRLYGDEFKFQRIGISPM